MTVDLSEARRMAAEARAEREKTTPGPWETFDEPYTGWKCVTGRPETEKWPCSVVKGAIHPSWDKYVVPNTDWIAHEHERDWMSVVDALADEVEYVRWNADQQLAERDQRIAELSAMLSKKEQPHQQP